MPTHRHHAIALHHTDLDILGARLHDLEQALDGELDCVGARQLFGVVFLEEFADRLGRAADGNGLCISTAFSPISDV